MSNKLNKFPLLTYLASMIIIHDHCQWVLQGNTHSSLAIFKYKKGDNFFFKETQCFLNFWQTYSFYPPSHGSLRTRALTCWGEERLSDTIRDCKTHSAILRYYTLHFTALHCTSLHCTAPPCTVLNCSGQSWSGE